jgi:hypothetical protein
MSENLDSIGPFNGPGLSFGDYGPGVSYDAAERLARDNAMNLAAASPKSVVGEVAEDVAQSFRSYDASAVPDDMPRRADLLRNVTYWIASSTRGEYAQFRDWMAERHAGLEQALDADHNIIMEGATARLNRLDDDCTDRIATTLMDVPIGPMNSLEAGLYGGARAVCYGVHGESATVGVANIYTNRVGQQGVNDAMSATYVHEGAHAWGVNDLAGFGDGLTSAGQPTSISEEVVAGGLTAATDNGNLEDFFASGAIQRGSYLFERVFIGLLGEHGSLKFGPDLLLEAFATPLDETSDQSSHPRAELARRLHRNTEELLLPGEDNAYFVLVEAIDGIWPHRRRSKLLEFIDTICAKQGIEPLYEDGGALGPDNPVYELVRVEDVAQSSAKTTVIDLSR